MKLKFVMIKMNATLTLLKSKSKTHKQKTTQLNVMTAFVIQEKSIKKIGR